MKSIIKHLEKYSPLTENKALILESKGINLTAYCSEIVDLACKGYSPEQIAEMIRKSKLK